MNKYREVIDYIRKEDVTLFVGSGCSIASEAPSAAKLTKVIWPLLEKDFQDENIRTSLQDVAESLVVQEANDRSKLNQVLVDSFSGLTPSSFHKMLMRVPHIHTIITTNYDSLIETAYALDYFQVLANNSELVTADSKKVQLLKIHGDLKHLEDIIITKSDYRRFLQTPTNSLLWSRIISEFTSKHIVFVGYSAEDQNILNLIEHIKVQTSDSVKKMYLIAPHLTPLQSKRLKNLGITTINGTGENFLEKVLSSLKESFGDDKYDNICSQDSLNRFALLNGLQCSLENDGKHTRITKLKNTDGSPCRITMNFSSESPDFMSGRTSVTIRNNVNGFDIPMYSLTEKELSTYRISVGDIRINGHNETSQVLICPAVHDIDIAFIANELGIDCRCKAKKYSEKSVCHILIPTPIFNFDLNFDFSDASNNAFPGVLTTKLNEGRFDDLEKAIKWSRLLVAMQENVNVTLYLGKIRLENLKISQDDKALHHYKQLLEYCNNLREIEQASNTIFSYYDGFTPDNFLYSKMIRSYIKHEAYMDGARREYKSFTIDVDKGDFQVNKKYVARIVTGVNGPISLCGVEYNIEEERIFILHCKADSVEHLDDGKDRVHLVNEQETIQYEYCNASDEDKLIGGQTH